MRNKAKPVRAVVDTNVLLVANEAHPDVSDDCLVACVERLEKLSHDGTVVIDDEWRILGEYLHKLDPKHGQPGVGDRFLKWLLRTQADTTHVHKVTITDTGEDCFAEFPDQRLQQAFDPPDRKFIAVAAADVGKAEVLQATDCKWLNWRQQLHDAGVHVQFICEQDVVRFYQQKFDMPAPELP